jgi:hypothetical protein
MEPTPRPANDMSKYKNPKGWCAVCKKRVALKSPVQDFILSAVPFAHKTNGVYCPGEYKQALLDPPTARARIMKQQSDPFPTWESRRQLRAWMLACSAFTQDLDAMERYEKLLLQADSYCEKPLYQKAPDYQI